MYKWHVHSAVGRGRPLAGDVTRLADGIATSLRLFHIAASRQAEDGAPRFTITRTQRSQAAAAEIFSLAPGGVDARSLAAKPPSRFTITRVETGNSGAVRTGLPRGAARGGFSSRGLGQRGGRGGFMRGRGRGRGAQGSRGGARGGTRKRGGAKNTSVATSATLAGEPLTEEQQAYVDAREMGIERPAPVGITDRESLELDVPPLATDSAPIGFVGTVMDRMRALAGQHGNERLSTEEHAKRYLYGNGTFFVDDEDKAKATAPDRLVGTPRRYDTLPEEERQVILQTLAAGAYEPLKPAAKGDILGAVKTYIQRNETYLQRDVASLTGRVQKLLPQQKAAQPARQAAKQ